MRWRRSKAVTQPAWSWWLAGTLLLSGCGDGPTRFIGIHQELSTTSGGGAASGQTTTSASSSAATDSGTTGSAATNCEVGTIPASLDAPEFYAKYAQSHGIPLLAPEVVADRAIVNACQLATQMLSQRADIAVEMRANGARIAIIGQNQGLREVPELQNLSSDWNDDRGVGASLSHPISVGAEENLLCLDDDVHRGEIIFVHSFAHAMRSLGIARIESDFDDRVESAYDAALFEGKWQDAFARVSFPQYWAEGVQSWFDVNLAPPNEIHNEINTRVELESYDPDLYDIIADYMPEESASLDCFTYLP